MPHGIHSKPQTAFRLPEGLLAWLKEQAEREGDTVTMTGIVVRALERERARCASPVLAAEDEQPEHAGTDRSWESAAELASRVTRRTDEGGKR